MLHTKPLDMCLAMKTTAGHDKKMQECKNSYAIRENTGSILAMLNLRKDTMTEYGLSFQKRVSNFILELFYFG